MPVVTSTDGRRARYDSADAEAGVGVDFKLVAGLAAERLGHPRSHAARAVAADFGDGAIGVVEADAAGTRAGPGLVDPGKELDAVGADAGVALAEAAGESRRDRGLRRLLR